MSYKSFTIGSLWIKTNKDKNGAEKTSRFIKLGKKSDQEKYQKYNYSVEIVVRNSTGQVVFNQTDGFVNLIDPRTEPFELAQRGFITEEQAAERVSKNKTLPEDLKYEVKLSGNK